MRRGEQDEEAIATAVALAREGHAVVMFPEGTRRRKGIRKKHEARWRTGAARIALEAGVPLVPAGIAGHRAARATRPAARRLRAADRRRRSRRRSRRARPRGSRPTGSRDAIARARAEARVRPLLVMDGDSFTHRAYHALPKSMRRADGGPGERAHRLHEHAAAALAGRAAADGARRVGHARRPDVSAHGARGVPERTRVRRRAPRAARPASRRSSRSAGFACAKDAGLRGGRLPRRRRRRRRRRPAATALVATSDRDAFQLVTTRVTVLQPARRRRRRGSARPRCASATASIPSRCRTSSRCAAIRRTRSPARAGSARSARRSCSASTASLDAMLDGRPLRDRGRCASPLPADRDDGSRRAAAAAARRRRRTGTAAAAHARELGLEQVRASLRGGARVDVISHPAFAHLHAAERRRAARSIPDALRVLHERFPGLRARRAGDRGARSSASTRRGYVDAIDGDRRARSGSIRTRTPAPTTWEAACLAAGCAIEAVEIGRLRARSAARPPRARSRRRWASASSANVAIAARHAQRELGLERVAIVDFDVHHGNGTEALFRDDPSVLTVSLHQWPFWPGTGRAGRRARTASSTSRSPPGSGDDEYARAFDEMVEPAVRAFEPELVHRRGGLRRASRRSAGGDGGDRGRASASSLGARAALAPRVAAVLEGGYNLDDAARPRRGGARGVREREPRRARATSRRSSASRRDETPSFFRRLLTCERTVCSEMKSRCAISSVPRCSSRRSSTSTSRAESTRVISSGTPLESPAVADAVEQPACDTARQRRVAARDAAEEGRDLLGRLGLQEVAGRAGTDRGEQVLLGVGCGQHDDLGLGRLLADLRERGEAVHPRHRQVEQHDVRLQLAGRGDRASRRPRPRRRRRSPAARAAPRARRA